MERVFSNSSSKPLAERLILALEEGDKQSASIIVKLRNEGYDVIDYRLVDIRVDNSKNPIRLYDISSEIYNNVAWERSGETIK
ncbi:MAG: hypothetical protein ABIL37_05045 [candidate division WOR-3 bacterium]